MSWDENRIIMDIFYASLLCFLPNNFYDLSGTYLESGLSFGMASSSKVSMHLLHNLSNTNPSHFAHPYLRSFSTL